MADPMNFGIAQLLAQPDPTQYTNQQIAAQQGQQINAGNIQAQQTANQNAQLQQQQAAAARTVVQNYMANPTPQGLSQVSIMAPQVFDSIKADHDLKNADQQRSDLQAYTGLQGQSKIAADTTAPAAARTAASTATLSMLQQRVAADTAAGRNSDADAALLAQAQAGNFNGVLGGSNLQLRGALGLDKFNETFKNQIEDAKTPSAIAQSQATANQANAEATAKGYMIAKDALGNDHILKIGPDGGPVGAPSAAPAGGRQIAGPVGQGITDAATAAGASPGEVGYLQTTARLESNGKPGASNGQSMGLFQFHPKTFSESGGGDLNSVADQTKGALTLARNNSAALTHALGQTPTPAQVYLAHQQGATGASALLLADPNQNAIAALQSAGVAPKIARLSITNNGGNPNMTAGQFTNMWTTRYNNAAGAPQAPQDASQPTPQAAAPSGLREVYSPPQTGQGQLSSDALDQAAQSYLATGEVPALGNGSLGAVNRTAVLNRAAVMQQATGKTGADAALAWADRTAQTSTLTNLSTLQAQVQASENTVKANMGIVTGLAPKGAGPSGSPALNAPIQMLRKNVWGAPQVAAYDAAIGTVADEYAKVMSSSTGTGGATSDSARNEAYERLSKAATIGQVQATMSTMQQEMANRSTSLSDAVQTTRSNMKSGQGPGGGQGTPVQATTPQAVMALPAGTPFIWSDGSHRVKH